MPIYTSSRSSMRRRMWGAWAIACRVRPHHKAPIASQVVATPLTIQHTIQIGTGITPIFTSAAMTGNSFVNASGATLEIRNDSSQGVVVTVTAQQACNQGYFHDYTINVPAGNPDPILMGPFDFHYNSSASLVSITYSYAIGVSVAVTAP